MNNQDKIDRLNEITSKMEQGIKDVFESDKYKKYLSTMSKFHNYSFRNSILIMLQKPEATYVAGFNTWKKSFNRTVLKGEKGIQILAPTPYRIKVEMEKIDPITQKPIMDDTGKPIKEMVEITKPAFRPVYVFDVTQTIGEPLPELITELKGDVHRYNIFIESLKNVSPFPIQYEDISGSTKGYCDYKRNIIAIKQGMSEIQTIKTAIHEITHADLHADQSKISLDSKDRRTKEIEAESVAYVVCNHYGIDTSDYSFTYLAAWSKTKELDELKNSLDTIQKQASDLIDRIDSHYHELLISQEKQKETLRDRINKAKETKDLTDTVKNNFFIYQLKSGINGTEKPDINNYDMVFSGKIESKVTIENIYQEYHTSIPDGFRGNNLSMSDIIVLETPVSTNAYYVDTIGFIDCPDFAKDHEINELLDTVRFDNEIDLDRERSREQLGFKDEDKPLSIADRIMMAKRALKERTTSPKKDISKGFDKNEGER